MSTKGSKLINLQSLPFHPFLVVFFQIFIIYAINVNIADIIAFMFILLIALILTALFFLFFSFITKDIKRSAIFVTFFFFLFFTYGRLYDIVFGLKIADLVIGRNMFLAPLYALILIVGTLWIFRSQGCKKYFEEITYFLNTLSFWLVIISVFVGITAFDWITFGRNNDIKSNTFFSIKKNVHQVSQSRKNIFYPNVYFMIFDMYASHKVLKKYFDWDDISVVQAFQTYGFSVNKNAYVNYPFTSLSLASTLNMRYIHEDRGFINAINKEYYSDQFKKQNEVIERFKSEGYDVVSFIGEYWLRNNKDSISYGYNSLLSNAFTDLVIHVSFLRIIEQEINLNRMRQDILSKLEVLKLFNIPNKPTFIFSYIMCPHPPYIFNADGTKPKLFESFWGRFEIKESYVEQVRFIGTQIIEIVDTLRRRDPSAVIIVEADHGNGSFLGTYSFNHERPPLEYLDAQYGILNAMYIPPDIMMPDKITPVNLFRYLFNALFDAKLEILPDRAFFSPTKEPYEFFEVTNDIKHLMAE